MAQAPKPNETSSPVSAVGSATAPVIYFEAAPVFGVAHGSILRVTLTTSLISPSNGNVQADHVVVAHLRMSALAARALKDALEKALLAVTPAPASKPN